jgi:hypothetical protein
MVDGDIRGDRRTTPERFRASAVAIALALPLALLPAQAAAEPGAPDLDSVVLSLAEVNAIVGGGSDGGGPFRDNSDRDRRAPKDYGEPPGVPEPCRNSDAPTKIYGADYAAYRSVSYSGFSNVGVNQAVVVYPSPEVARRVFDTYVANLKECQAVYPNDIYGPTPVITTIPGTDNVTVLEQQGPGIGRGWARLVQVYGANVISVGAGNFPPDTPVVWQVLSRIQQNLDAQR